MGEGEGKASYAGDGDYVIHVGDQPLTETAEDILAHDLPGALMRFLAKNRGYGDYTASDALGSKAQFIDIWRKTLKLRRALWEGEDIGHEPVDEVLDDLLGHVLLMKRMLRKEADSQKKKIEGPF